MGDPIPTLSWLGVDVGWVYPAVDSGGRIHHWAPGFVRRRADREYARAGDLTVRRPDGTVEVHDAITPAGVADNLERGPHDPQKRRALADRVIRQAVKDGRGIALEDWADRDPRDGVWIQVHRDIAYRAKDRGIPVAFVPRAYTSQTCPECLHVEAANRPERNTFRCVECHYEGHADVVAAVNIAEIAAEGGDDVRYLLPDVESIGRSVRVAAGVGPRTRYEKRYHHSA